jgi:hypothetical protein
MKQLKLKTKFLGLQVDSNLNWKTHTHYIISKPSLAWFAMSTVTSFVKVVTLKHVYSISNYFLGKLKTAEKHFTSKRRWSNGRH